MEYGKKIIVRSASHKKVSSTVAFKCAECFYLILVKNANRSARQELSLQLRKQSGMLNVLVVWSVLPVAPF